MIEIRLSTVLVDDQQRALDFYTEILGFEKKTDIPMGEARWLTVVSPAAPDGVELLLEPNANPAAKAFQKALRKQGIPANAFQVDDIQAEYGRMEGLGVKFRSAPQEAGNVVVAILDDTCGNWIQLYQL